MNTSLSVAYFSMEIGLDWAMPTYSGGLGVLAGDTLRAAADASLSMVGVTLLSRKGYFRQRLDEAGRQSEEAQNWVIEDYLIPLDVSALVQVEGRPVTVRAWQYDIKGVSGHVVPVYFLDTDVDGNEDQDRVLTDSLYGGDQHYRLCQEVILGIGGVKLLRSLGYENVRSFHMNEGHSALLIFELLAERLQQSAETKSLVDCINTVRRRCIFTTHTPVAAGHDRFPLSLVHRVLEPSAAFRECTEEFSSDGELNLTHLALSASYYINGVARKHRDTSLKMFEGYHIDFITNGVHAATWASDAMIRLFDQCIPGWRSDNSSLRYALGVSCEEIQDAHQQAKRKLLEYTNKLCNAGLDQNVFTIGFARRATPYKRAALLFSDVDRLRAIAEQCGPIQLIFAGKAHPRDEQGKELICQIFRIRDELGDNIRLAYLPDYDMQVGKLMTAGVDLWLNTPLPPMEASGTSGMKAAVNGVPSLSVLDGWWLEGCIEGVTGWAIGNGGPYATEDDLTAAEEVDILYHKLSNVIIPLYYQDNDNYTRVMRNAIAINGSFFNTERMISQYVTKAYFR